MSHLDKQKIVDSVPQKGFFGHPKGLFTLFFTEFWERFSYYGMRAILVFYMYYEVSKGGLGLPENTALAIMSIYGSLVYMSGIIGGWLADRLFGTSKAVFYGGVLIMLGHIVLAIPGSVPMFFVSMVLIVLGTGLLKPNVSSVVGDLYSETDNRRDAGFSIFYMGINLGGFLSPFIVGTVGTEVDFHLGFALAAIGMFIGLITFLLTRSKNLGLAGQFPSNPLNDAEKKRTGLLFSIAAIIIALFVGTGLYYGYLTFDVFVGIIGILGFLIPTVYFVVMYRSPKTTPTEKSRVLAYIPLFIASVMFWAIQEQGSTILANYADKRTQLSFAGIELSPAWFQSMNPLFIIMLAPVFAWLWVKLGARQPSIPKKFSIGLLFAGLSFLVMLFPAYLSGGSGLVNPLWLVLSYFIVVLGELCLSPVGLSATTKLAPAAFSAQTMSLWFLSNAAGQAINAQVVQYYSIENEIMYFGIIGGSAIALGILLYLFTPFIRKFMQGVD
ncbi:peptide MFS transporter [Alkalicoccobacillus murimartini]|uniref:POT family proton-dependent oligopeptide transporter n=1 Tax=Alkalicoccobacillus murimartini TaxID=171685 RepID=A0ABT9YD00_9BACI|nr:peptide MFS transporter [Alkalicoccobacillus murimartini]MDQ0205733.1 POT family proton-dependent oligopeptide transporter [Alkalicoccobacillus murimartini]